MNPTNDHLNEQASLYFARASDAELKAEESWDDHMRDSWQCVADSWRALAAMTTSRR